MSATLRSGSLDDVEALLTLERDSFSGDRLGRRQFRHLIARGNSELALLEAQGKPMGYALLLYRRGSGIARLYSLAVAMEARGQGHGKRLLNWALARARARGCRALSLEVRLDNEAATSLYRRFGFRPFQRIPGYYEDGAEAARMRLDLGPDNAAAPPPQARGNQP